MINDAVFHVGNATAQEKSNDSDQASVEEKTMVAERANGGEKPRPPERVSYDE